MSFPANVPKSDASGTLLVTCCASILLYDGSPHKLHRADPMAIGSARWLSAVGVAPSVVYQVAALRMSYGPCFSVHSLSDAEGKPLWKVGGAVQLRFRPAMLVGRLDPARGVSASLAPSRELAFSIAHLIASRLK